MARAGVLPSSIQDQTPGIAAREAAANDALARLFYALMAKREDRAHADAQRMQMFNLHNQEYDRRFAMRYPNGNTDPNNPLFRYGPGTSVGTDTGGAPSASPMPNSQYAPLPTPYGNTPGTGSFTPDPPKNAPTDVSSTNKTSYNFSADALNSNAQASPEELKPRDRDAYRQRGSEATTKLYRPPGAGSRKTVTSEFLDIPQQVLQAWANTEKRYNLPRGVIQTTFGFENGGGRQYGKNPNSSASGWFQFTDQLKKEYGLSPEDTLDPIKMGEITGRNMRRNAQALERVSGGTVKLGNSATDVPAYTMLHMFGIGDGSRLVYTSRVNPDYPAAQAMLNLKNRDGTPRDNGRILADQQIPSNASVGDVLRHHMTRVMPWFNATVSHQNAQTQAGSGDGGQPPRPQETVPPSNDAKAWLKSRALGGANIDGLNPQYAANMAALLQKAEAATGQRAQIKSGHRTYEEQADLRHKFETGRGPIAARPGQSRHEDTTGEGGRAIDVVRGPVLSYLRQNRELVAQHGGEFLPDHLNDHVHIQQIRGPAGKVVAAPVQAQPQQQQAPRNVRLPSVDRDVTSRFNATGGLPDATRTSLAGPIDKMGNIPLTGRAASMGTGPVPATMQPTPQQAQPQPAPSGGADVPLPRPRSGLLSDDEAVPMPDERGVLPGETLPYDINMPRPRPPEADNAEPVQNPPLPRPNEQRQLEKTGEMPAEYNNEFTGAQSVDESGFTGEGVYPGMPPTIPDYSQETPVEDNYPPQPGQDYSGEQPFEGTFQPYAPPPPPREYPQASADALIKGYPDQDDWLKSIGLTRNRTEPTAAAAQAVTQDEALAARDRLKARAMSAWDTIQQSLAAGKKNAQTAVDRIGNVNKPQPEVSIPSDKVIEAMFGNKEESAARAENNDVRQFAKPYIDKAIEKGGPIASRIGELSQQRFTAAGDAIAGAYDQFVNKGGATRTVQGAAGTVQGIVQGIIDKAKEYQQQAQGAPVPQVPPALREAQDAGGAQAIPTPVPTPAPTMPRVAPQAQPQVQPQVQQPQPQPQQGPSTPVQPGMLRRLIDAIFTSSPKAPPVIPEPKPKRTGYRVNADGSPYMPRDMVQPIKVPPRRTGPNMSDGGIPAPNLQKGPPALARPNPDNPNEMLFEAPPEATLLEQ